MPFTVRRDFGIGRTEESQSRRSRYFGTSRRFLQFRHYSRTIGAAGSTPFCCGRCLTAAGSGGRRRPRETKGQFANRPLIASVRLQIVRVSVRRTVCGLVRACRIDAVCFCSKPSLHRRRGRRHGQSHRAPATVDQLADSPNSAAMPDPRLGNV